MGSRVALPAVLALGALLLCGAPTGADGPPPDDPAARSPVRAAGLRALDAGRREEAAGHFRRALGDHPASPTLLADLVRATDDRPAQRAFWLHQWAAAAADRGGAFRAAKELAPLVGKEDPHVREVALARARAAADLARLAGVAHGPGAWTTVKAWRRLFLWVAEASPALREAHREAFEKALEKARPATGDVLRAIEQGTRASVRPEEETLRLRLGRALIGLASQSAQKLGGTPDGDPARWISLGERLIRSAETALAAKQMEPASLAALEAMDGDAVADFNETRTDVATPGRALTPSGLYEVTTPCGHATLTATTREAERIHARLAKWLGGDPFGKRRGLIRVLPEYADLESENAPYWWAGGFQRGLVTTIQFSHGNALDIARILTHELTHRFDAAVYPAMPTWMVEGRAVFTAVAFGGLGDAAFRDVAADGGRIADAWFNWYGTPEGLPVLLKGEPKDYRDNYTAGHALWTYLWTWSVEGPKPLFKGRVPAFLAPKTAPKDPVAHFVATFADGKEGRPSGLPAFCDGFRAFMEGFRAYPRPEWMALYAPPATDEERPPLIWDGPTLSRSRERAEPTFGQDHVRRAADVLGRLKQTQAAILLLEWADAFDELDGPAANLRAELLRDAGSDAAAAAAHLERLRQGSTPEDVRPRPSLAPLTSPALQAYLQALADAATDYHARGWDDAARWFQDEHNAIAAQVDRPGVRVAEDLAPDAPKPTPFLGMPVLLGSPASGGWQEDVLTDFDEYRQPGLWHVTPEGHLVVGSKADETIQKSYEEKFYESSVRSREAPESGYVLRARIVLLTPYVSGAVVFGWKRRDRNVRLYLSAGDRPRKDAGPLATHPHEEAELRLSSRRSFDWFHLEGERSHVVQVDPTTSAFDLRAVVEGARVTFWVGEQQVGSAVDAEGMPVDGSVGFATDAGAFRVEAPTLQRLRGRTEDGRPTATELDVAAPRAPLGDWVISRRVHGMAVAPHGTIVHWFPLGAAEAPGAKPEAQAAVAADVWKDVVRFLDAARHRADVVVAIPALWPAPWRDAFRAAAAGALEKRGRVVEHEEGKVPGTPPAPAAWGQDPQLLFVDPVGIVRLRSEAGWAAIPEAWGGWLRLTRGW